MEGKKESELERHGCLQITTLGWDWKKKHSCSLLLTFDNLNTKSSHNLEKSVTLNKNRVPSLGVQLDNDLIRVQDPHVNVGEVKMHSSKFDLFAFTCVGVRGLIMKGQELGVYKTSDHLSCCFSAYLELRALHELSVPL